MKDTPQPPKVAPDVTDVPNAPHITDTEQIRPFVYRNAIQTEEAPFLSLVLVYSVRPNHEDEDTKTLDAAAVQANLAVGLYVPGQGGKLQRLKQVEKAEQTKEVSRG